MPVELDGGDVRTGLGERQRQRPEARADLHHPVARLDPGQADDAPQRVRVDDEVLTQGAARADAVPLEKVLRLPPGDHPDRFPRARQRQVRPTWITPWPGSAGWAAV